MHKTLLLKIAFTFFLLPFLGFSQIEDVEKILFIQDVKMIQTAATEYSFKVGYVAKYSRDISLEFSGGDSKFWLNKVVSVKKGRGIIDIKLEGLKKPTASKGYKIVLGLRKRNGDWTTTITSVVLNNIEVVNENVLLTDDASLPTLISNKIAFGSVYKFEVNYNFLQENIVQVSIWNGTKWLSSSLKEAVPAGKGVKSISVALKKIVSGTKFRFMLAFGTTKDFENKTPKTKEITGIEITTEDEKISVDDLNKKSIELTIDQNTQILQLLGDPKYECIKLISTNGIIIDQFFNTNKINTKLMTIGNYFIVTDTGYYFKFTKK